MRVNSSVFHLTKTPMNWQQCSLGKHSSRALHIPQSEMFVLQPIDFAVLTEIPPTDTKPRAFQLNKI